VVGGMTLAPIVILISLPVLIALFSRRHVSVERREVVVAPAE
jgi:cobalt-zinc-cadmium resistance protein CzcA